MRVIRRSLPQHMAEGYAPRHLVHQIRVLGKPGDSTSAAEFHGEKVSARFESLLVEALVDQFFADHQPKTIIRVPPVSGGSGRLVERIATAFHARSVRTLDATGVGGDKQATFLNALREERERTYPDSQFDIIIGIQRVLEGTDWKHCSAVYCLGMPGGLAMVGQLLGRALRQKGEDCSVTHRDTARIVFFVPGSGSLQKLGLQHSRNALLTSVFLADFEVGEEWAMAQGVRAGISAAFGSEPRIRSGLRSSLTMDEETKVEATALLLNARHHLKTAGIATPTLQEIVQTATTLATETGSALTERELQRAAVLLAATRTGTGGKRVRDAVEQTAEQVAVDWIKATSVKEDPQISALLDEIFSKLRDDFRDETLEGSAVLELVGTQLHSLTGGHMVSFMERMRDAFPRVITHKMILQWLNNHFDGKPNKQLSKLSEFIPGTERFGGGYPLTWGQLEKALLRGSHGLPGNECLAEIIDRHFGTTCSCQAALDSTKVHVSDGPTPILIEYHIRRTGCFPVPCDELIPHTDLTWSMLHSTVLTFRNSMGLGLAEGQEHLAMAYYFLHENLVSMVAEWVAGRGQVPGTDSGVIPHSGGLTWADADGYIKERTRCYLKEKNWSESTVRQLSQEECVRTHWISWNIYKWVGRWIRATGSPPTSNSGVIPDSGGVSWAEVDDVFRRTYRIAYPKGLSARNMPELDKSLIPYAYSSLNDRIAHFQIVKEVGGRSGDGDFGSPT
jgi:hypothetical protein